MSSFSRSILLSYQNLMQADHHIIASHMRTSGLPKIEQSRLTELCKLSIDILKKQSTLVHINGPAVVVGDIHGSIIDLLRIFGIYGFPFINKDNKNIQNNNRLGNKQENSNSSLKYVFLGDYVDRGDFSVEVMTLLLSAFCSYPNNIVLLRGNHEFSNISSSNGFKDEILDHPTGYSPELFERIHDVFAYLPYAAVINNNIFCVHGGLSNRLTNLQDIEKLSDLRPIYDYKEIPLIQDLVWSDPSPIGCCDFIPSTRNQGCIYGSTAVNNFYQNTGIQAIIRGHSYVKEGVAIYSHINLLSVFSSSNYLKLPIKLNSDEKNCNLHSCFQNFTPNNNFALDTENSSVLKKDDRSNLSGVVFVDEESIMSPEIFEPVESISREETKLRTSASISFASSQMISSIPFVPNNNTDQANNTNLFKPKITDYKEKFYNSELKIKSKEQKKKNKTPEVGMNSGNIPTPTNHFSVFFPPKTEEDSTSMKKVKHHKRRKFSHDSLQQMQYSLFTLNSKNDYHADDSSSTITNSISESSSSSSNLTDKKVHNDPFEKIDKPVFIKAAMRPKKRKAKKSLPNMKFNNII